MNDNPLTDPENLDGPAAFAAFTAELAELAETDLANEHVPIEDTDTAAEAFATWHAATLTSPTKP